MMMSLLRDSKAATKRDDSSDEASTSTATAAGRGGVSLIPPLFREKKKKKNAATKDEEQKTTTDAAAAEIKKKIKSKNKKSTSSASSSAANDPGVGIGLLLLILTCLPGGTSIGEVYDNSYFTDGASSEGLKRGTSFGENHAASAAASSTVPHITYAYSFMQLLQSDKKKDEDIDETDRRRHLMMHRRSSSCSSSCSSSSAGGFSDHRYNRHQRSRSLSPAAGATSPKQQPQPFSYKSALLLSKQQQPPQLLDDSRSDAHCDLTATSDGVASSSSPSPSFCNSSRSASSNAETTAAHSVDEAEVLNETSTPPPSPFSVGEADAASTAATTAAAAMTTALNSDATTPATPTGMCFVRFPSKLQALLRSLTQHGNHHGNNHSRSNSAASSLQTPSSADHQTNSPAIVVDGGCAAINSDATTDAKSEEEEMLYHVPKLESWSCTYCGNVQHVSDKCHCCKQPNVSLRKVFFGQLRKEGAAEVITYIINKLYPGGQIPVLHVDPHVNPKDKRGKGCAGVYIAADFDADHDGGVAGGAAQKLLDLHYRVFLDVDDATGDEGFWVCDVGFENQLAQFATERATTHRSCGCKHAAGQHHPQRQQQRPMVLPPGRLVAELANMSRPSRTEVSRKYANAPRAAVMHHHHQPSSSAAAATIPMGAAASVYDNYSSYFSATRPTAHTHHHHHQQQQQQGGYSMNPYYVCVQQQQQQSTTATATTMLNHNYHYEQQEESQQQRFSGYTARQVAEGRYSHNPYYPACTAVGVATTATDGNATSAANADAPTQYSQLW